MIFVNFKKTARTNDKSDISFRRCDMRNYVVAKLHHNLNSLDWTQFYESTNPTDCWEMLYTNYITVLNVLVPFKTIMGSSKKEEWVTGECLSKIRHRDILRSKLTYDCKNDKLRSEFKEARNSTRQFLDNARQD